LDSVTGPKTRVIDCQGKTVLPGFNDAHCHIFSAIRKLLSLDLGPSAVGSITDIKAAVRREAEHTPPGRWISGVGFNEFYLAEKRFPTRRDIDEVAPNHPVVLSHRSLHACVLNFLALSLAGINRETPEPPGTLIEREFDTGEPNGILYEMLGYIREKVMPPISEEVMIKCAAQANRHYLSCGITSLQDATVTNDYKRWLTLEQLIKADILESRLYMMTGREGVGEFREAGLKTGAGDERLRLGAVKLMLTATAKPSQSELNRAALDLHCAGFQLAFHAVEPAMVAAAIEALEYVNTQITITGSRHRIEHCAECPPDLLKRLSRLPVVVVTQPPFVYYSGERYLATLPADRLPWLYQFKSFFDGGLKVAGSSDSPIVPDSPLAGMCAAVTRKAASGQDVLPHEAITDQQAIAMYTTNAAYASCEENIKGSITPGKLADMVILSADPTVIPPEKIKDVKVEMTIIGGRVVWEA
ncbi:MAG: amidohydrolase, partial [Dehalococcoidales bacterium]|nr:amidohydrolase [Dehalococcoidales bacterium]